MQRIKLYTIGFTKKSAEVFFSEIRDAGVKTVIDVRLNNISQLAGFAKRDDLVFFLRELCDCKYAHIQEFAPTKEILDAYKKKEIDWHEYAQRFMLLIEERKIETKISIEQLDKACLLCSEPRPEHCHRRLVSEYLTEKFKNIDIKHL